MVKLTETSSKRCIICEKTFSRRINDPDRGTEKLKYYTERKTCGKASCMNKAKSLGKGGPKHRQSFAIQLARKYKRTECNRCGDKKNLVFHHIDRNWKNNNLSNIEVLCRRCHVDEHYDENNLSRKRVNHGNCTHCDRKAVAVGMCKMHRKRFLRRGTADDMPGITVGARVSHDPHASRPPRRIKPYQKFVSKRDSG